MDLPLDPISDRVPPELSASWDEAYSRVESYLRAHQIHNRILVNRLVNDIVGRAMKRHESEPEMDPVTLAAEEADRTMAAWFSRVLEDPSISERRLSVRGRLALLMADVPNRWPNYFLRDGSVPGRMSKSMQDSFLEAGPDLQFSNMAPRPIDLGPIVNAAGETWETFNKWPLIRAIVLWIILLSLLGVVFYTTR